MCIVEIEGRRGFATSCIQTVEEGMVIHTHTPNVLEARHVILDLIISNHAKDCLTCTRSGNCELQTLAVKFNVLNVEFPGEMTKHKVDDLSPSIVRDFNKCILCRRCVAACKNIQKIGAIDCINRGFESCISTVGDHSLNDVNCTNCGQCIQACPTGALHEKETINDVWVKLKDPDTYVVVQTAPAVRVALGEEFGMPIGTNVKGKMVTALKRLGFDKVFDTNTGADFTIIEEAHEFIERLKKIKGIEWIIVVVACLVIFLIYYSSSFSKSGTSDTNISVSSSSQYAKEVEDKLSKVLSNVSGAGKVSVMLTLESGSEIIVAKTKEERTNTSSNSTSVTVVESPVIVGKEPLILMEILPKIKGVIVVAQGANDVAVRLELLRAVQALIDVDSNKIEIFVGK